MLFRSVIFANLTKETKEKCRNSRARAVKNAQIPFFKLSIMKMDNFDQLIKFTAPAAYSIITLSLKNARFML